MARGALKAVEPDEDLFAHSEITMKGVEYRFVELDGKTYDECYEMATLENGNLDTALLLKVMLPKSLVSPKLSADKIAALPMSMRRTLLQEVDRLHFPPIVPVVPEKTDGE